MRNGLIAVAAGVMLLVAALYTGSALLHMAAVAALIGGAVWTGVGVARLPDAGGRLAGLLARHRRRFALAAAVVLMAPVVAALAFMLLSLLPGIAWPTPGVPAYLAVVLFLLAALLALWVAIQVLRGAPPSKTEPVP